MSQETQILLKAKELFFKIGVKSITMDDLSKELGISKKTLYNFVENKSDLVNKTLILHFQEEKELTLEMIYHSKNAIDEVISMAKHGLKQFRNMHPSSIYDIKKYYPKAWNIIEQYKSDFIYNCIKQNLSKGKLEGFYRTDLNGDVIAKLYINSIDFIVNPHNFPATEYNFPDLYKEFIAYHIEGIVSEKGSQYLKDTQLEDNE